MTDAEWRAGAAPSVMLEHLRGRASERKLRLIAAAGCRRLWHWQRVADERCLAAIEASEQFADGHITETELDHRSAGAEEAYEDAITDSLGGDERPGAAGAGHASSYASSPSLPPELVGEAFDTVAEESPLGIAEERRVQADLIRCAVGNPFRPVALDPDWRTSTVLALAEGIYADRTFDRLPVLADALEDAGCDQPDILGHLRGPGPHARGCWVVDLILGKC